MFNEISLSLVDWSRAQFALTAAYHWIFVPLTLGLALIMAVMETLYVVKGDEFWLRTAKFWMKLFGINFAVGVATGLILEFEFGTNWSNYSQFVGDIFGAPLAIEAIVAFFMESTFVAVMFFGWNKVGKKFHLAATWLTGLGATISAWWILVANAWMQHPVGMTFNPATVRNEMSDFAAVALSPIAVMKFFHAVTSGWVVGAAFVVGISCWYLWKKREEKFARASIKVGATVGFVAALAVALTGDGSGVQMALAPTHETGCRRGTDGRRKRRALYRSGRHKSPENAFDTCHSRHKRLRAGHKRHTRRRLPYARRHDGLVGRRENGARPPGYRRFRRLS